MRIAAQFRHRLRSLLSHRAVEQELDEELRYHVERQIEEDIARGMTPEEARRTAMRSLTGIEARKDECRDARGLNLLDHFIRDLRFSVRQLRKSPTFTGVTVLVLALGLSAAVAIYACVDAALVQPLPYPNPSRLVAVTESVPAFPFANLSYPDYLDWKRTNRVFQSLDVYSGTGFLLGTPDGAEPVPAARVSDGFFRTLGIRPMLGRDFHAGEDSPAASARVVILTHAAWQNRFSANAGIVGKTILLSSVPYTVIGVLPREFQFAPLGAAEFWTVLDSAGSCAKRRSCHDLVGVARLNDGVSREAALANLTTIARELEQQYPDSNRGQGAALAPLAEIVNGEIRPVLQVLMAGAALLLLIACVNVASLLVVRTENRRREFALRGALGASAGRLFSQFVTEGLVLVTVGGVAGLILGAWSIRLLLALIPARMMAGMPFLQETGLNGRVILVALTSLGIAIVLFSLVPAAHLALSRMTSGIAEGSRGSSGLTWRRIGSKLVVVEFAAAMVLLVGAGLLGKSLYRLMRVDIGFRADHLVTMGITAPASAYPRPEQRAALNRRIIAEVREMPGVHAVGITSVLPVSYNGNTDWIRLVGRPYNGEHNDVNLREVSPDYLPTIGAKLISGRYFTETDDVAGRRVIIINRTLAQKYFPGENPIGRQIGDIKLSPSSIREIIGVVEDIREGSLDSGIYPATYVPFNLDPGGGFWIVARTSQDAASVLPQVRAAIRKHHPELGITNELTMEQRIDMSMSAWLHRSAAWLTGAFAAVSLWLGVVGLYGVVAYAVSRRTREIGVRMALGAAPPLVLRMIVREAMLLAGVAIALGVAASVGAGALMRGLFFGVQSWDAAILSSVIALLLLAAVFASYIPARRAASVNPAEALRAE